MRAMNLSFEVGLKSLHHDHYKQKDRKARQKKRAENTKKWEGRE